MADRSRAAYRDEAPQVRGRRLESWKEIASYLNRHVTTVRRWERLEGLPVHRHLHGALGSVYAYSGELDSWFEGRRPDRANQAMARTGTVPEPRLPSPALLAEHGAPAPFTGRDAEWRTLEACWGRALEHRSQLVLVTGEPGIGKTRLAFEFARSLAPAATILIGRCDREGIVPFAPFVEILEWLKRVSPAALLGARLAAIDGSAELAQLVPDLASLTRVRTRAAATPEGRRYRLFEAFGSLLRALSRTEPVLLVIEDAQWADRGSLLLLRHLVRGVDDARICSIVTYAAPGPARSGWSDEMLADLRREPSASQVALGPLSDEHVRALAGAWMKDRATPHLSDIVARTAQGNPLFAVEMLAHLGTPAMLARVDSSRAELSLTQLGLAHRLQDLIVRRLSASSDTCQRLLTLGAVAGPDFHVSTVEALAGLPEEAVLDGIDEAIAGGVLREEPGEPGRLSFAHALVREALYAGLTAARRVRLHHQVAEALERQSATRPVPIAELAHHFAEAAAFRDAAKAADYATRAGHHAASMLALEDAARHYGVALHALELLPQDAGLNARRFDLHERRGRSFFQVGQWSCAAAEFGAALVWLDPADQVTRCRLLVSLAETAFWLMDVPGLRRYAADAQRLAEAVQHDDLWAEASAWAASADAADGNLLGAIESDRRAIARAGGVRSFGLARAPLTLYWAGCTAEAVERGAEAVERARSSGDPAFLLYALQHAGISLSGAGRYSEAFEAFEEAETFGRRCGALPLLARALSMSVAPLLSLGDLEGASMRALEARELAHRVGFEPPLVSAGIDLLLIAARSGHPDRSVALLPEIARAVRSATGWHAWKWQMRLWQARAELALARNDPHEALIAASHVVDQSRARRRVKYEALGLSVRARAHALLGSRAGACDARDATEIARALGDPAVLLHCLACWLQLETREDLLNEAADTARRMAAAAGRQAPRRRFVASLPPLIRAHV